MASFTFTGIIPTETIPLTGTFTLTETIICIIIIHTFYIALFFALEQTHCAHVACDSK